MAFFTSLNPKHTTNDLIFFPEKRTFYIRAIVKSPLLGRQVISAMIRAGNDQMALVQFNEMIVLLGWAETIQPVFASDTLVGHYANRNRINDLLDTGEYPDTTEAMLLKELEDCLDDIDGEEMVATELLATELYIAAWMGLAAH